AWYLDGGSGRRLPAFLSVFVERLSGLLVLLVIAIVAVIFCPLHLEPFIPLTVLGLAGAALLTLAALFALPYLPWPPGRFPVVYAKLLRFHDQLVAALRLYCQHPRLLVSTTILSFLVQAGNVVLVWLIGLALSLPVPLSFYWILVPVV